MRWPIRCCVSLLWLCGGTCSDSSQELAANNDLVAFFAQHCVDCHGASEPEADVRLDALALQGSEPANRPDWAQIVAVLDASEMPPADHPQPTPQAVAAAIRGISRHAAETRQASSSALRRMNRREYQNTVHDLLGIDVPLLDLLPADGSVQGFDNVADGLSISSVLMEQYLEAANVAFDAVIRRIEPLPAETRRADLMEIKDNIDSVAKQKGGTIEVDDSFVKFTPGWPPARIDTAHPIEDGVYRCRVAVWPHDAGERTLSLAIYVGSLFGPETRKFIGIYDVTGTADEPRVIEFVTHMKEGHSIHLLPRIWPEHVTWRDKHEPRPGVGIVWAETHGPLDQSFPSEAQRRLFGNPSSITMVPDKPISMRHRKGVKLHIVASSQPREDAIRILREFIPRAFRRPVSDAEMQPFVDLTVSRLEAGRSFEQAVRTGVTAVLCAPQFLLLNARADVDEYTMASRLSYFLWSTMPDETLLELAAAGQLRDPAVRSAQVQRMLKDPRVDAFVENFTGQWLDLREIEFTTPDAKLYPEFDPLLQTAMLEETHRFFRHVLQQNRSVLDFVDADYTFLNERLATHYGMEGIRGNELFQKIALPEASIRGGVLTQASVLKVTANGTTTSPVLRGVWMLDAMLGRTMPPPPPGVPAVEPDVRGATTIREQLAKHSSDNSCAVCHRRIDPPGFDLDQFDAIGGQREWYRSIGEGERIEGNKSYRRGPDVQPAGTLPDGREFADFREYRSLLMSKPRSLARAMATKLLIYGMGRRVTVADREVVDDVVSQSEAADFGLQSMIEAIVSHHAFEAP